MFSIRNFIAVCVWSALLVVFAEQGFKPICTVLFPNSRTVNPMWADNELLSALIAGDNAPQLILWRVYRSLAQLYRHRAKRANLFAIGFEAHNFTFVEKLLWPHFINP